MIQLIEGEPGSGKSFFFCNYLFKFCSFDALYGEYVLDSHVLVITNVEGLKVPHWQLDHCLEGRTLEEFFSIANFESIQKKTGKTHIILAIDEAHDYFPDGYKNKDVYSFFAFHRHIGLDVFLMCQGLSAMSRLFLPLLETIIRARPRTSKMGKKMKYAVYTKKGKFLYPRSVAAKDIVFGMYKSFRSDEKNKPVSAVKIWVCFIAVCISLGAGFIYYSVSTLGGNSRKMAEQKFKMHESRVSSVKEVPAPAPVPLPPTTIVNAPVAYPLEGWIEKEGQLWFMIAGRSYPDSPLFSGFDPHAYSVFYHGSVPLKGGNDSPAIRRGMPDLAQPPVFGG